MILESFVNFLSFVGHASLGKCLPIPPSLRSVVFGWNTHLGRGGNKGRKYTQLKESVLCHDVIPVVKDPSQKIKMMEVRGIDPRTSRMLSERSTI